MKLGVGENKVAQVGLIMLSLIFLIILFWRKFSFVALILVIVIYLIVIRFAFEKPKRSQNTKKKALEKGKN